MFYDSKEGFQTTASLSLRMRSKHLNLLEYVVPVTSLDTYVAKNAITNIDLIKIDVELHEPEVLAGMHTILSDFRPYILIEVLLPDIASRLNAILSNYDYLYYHFESKDETYKLRQVTELVGKVNYDWNYLLCPREKKGNLQDYESECI